MHCTPILPSRGLPVSFRRVGRRRGAVAPLRLAPRHGAETWVVTPVLDTTHAAVSVPAGHRHIRRPRVGLVLSGGGARGVAQVGVIRELERSGVPIDFIAATSIGSIIGGLYASGYTTTELESICVHTDWDEVLSLADETKRTDLYLDQKLAVQKGFLVLRFEGLEPVLPSAVSSGQRLTEYLSNLTLQAIYHPFPTFDELRIPFRAMTTDLVSGQPGDPEERFAGRGAQGERNGPAPLRPGRARQPEACRRWTPQQHPGGCGPGPSAATS